MQFDSANTLNLTPAMAPAALGHRGLLTDSQRQFAGILGQMDRADRPLPGTFADGSAAPALKTEEQARAAAQQFVAVALVQPLLGQLRSSNAAAGVFAPSQGEKQFQTMFDAQIAERIVTASNFGIVDKLTDQLMKRIRGSSSQSSAETSAGAVDLAA